MENKINIDPNVCIVAGCGNRKDQGKFVGNICAPCYKYLTEGKIGSTNSFLKDLIKSPEAVARERCKRNGVGIMMTITDHIRARIYERSGLLPDGEAPKRNYLPPLESLRDSEWSEEFEQFLRARLILGGIRYGLLNSTGKRKYDRISSCISRLEEYKRTGNDELLVDVANFCMLEFEEGTHPNKHFRAGDDGEHVSTID